MVILMINTSEGIITMLSRDSRRHEGYNMPGEGKDRVEEEEEMGGKGGGGGDGGKEEGWLGILVAGGNEENILWFLLAWRVLILATLVLCTSYLLLLCFLFHLR